MRTGGRHFHAQMLARNLLLLALAAGLVCACKPSLLPVRTKSGPRALIQAPLDGSDLPLAPVEVISLASHTAGVSEVELSVDGVVVARDPYTASSNNPVTTHQVWLPSTQGSYMLRVRAKSVAGVWGDYSEARVNIQGENLATAELSSVPTAPAAPTEVLPEATSAPTETPVPETVATEPPPAAPPTPTETAVVIMPTATPSGGAGGPAVGAPTFSVADFYHGGGGCGPQQVTISVRASDSAGVSSVRLYYMLANKDTGLGTSWAPLDMAPADGVWACTISAENLPGHESFANAWFQFYFVATNAQGVQTKSPGYYTSVTLRLCS